MTSRALAAALLALAVHSSPALAQPPTAAPVTRRAALSWDASGAHLLATLDFRDVVDDTIQQKLRRGLPTRLFFTALTYRAGGEAPVSSAYLSCKITWHVWEEMYRVELTTSSQTKAQRHWTPTLEGVLRRCARASDLLVATRQDVPHGVPISVRGAIRVNPLDDELMNRLRQWVTRPSRNTTAAPGSALFSTFTGLFMQRLGDAEKTELFITPALVPAQRPPR